MSGKRIADLINASENESSSSSESDSPPPSPPRSRALPREPYRSATNQKPEDEFDVAILTSSQYLETNGSSSPRNVEEHLPAVFDSIPHYRRVLLPLILEECKAILSSAWKDFSKGDEKAEKAQGCKLSVYSPGIGEWFSYVEVKKPHGCLVNLDTGQIVFVQTSGITKAIAIVDASFTNSCILRTHPQSGLIDSQYDLYPVDNLTTLRRAYVSVSNVGELSSSLVQQVLNPSVNGELNFRLKDSAYCDKLLSQEGSLISHPHLNRQQQLAVLSALHLRQGFFLVQGPPGTGKTTTILGMVSALLCQTPQPKILVCAPSNAALDELVGRMMEGMYDSGGKKYVPQKGFIVRLGPRASISNACYGATLDGLLSEEILFTTRQAAEKNLVNKAAVICTTLSSCAHRQFDELSHKLDLIIIDEAVQAVEAEILIALNRVKSRCIMIGDPCQLPATVFQHPALAFRRSMFERMQEAGLAPHFLDTQYRMHRLISYFPSHQFYNGALKDAMEIEYREPILVKQQISTGDFCFILDKYAFFDLNWGTEETENHSRFNVEEAKAVVSVVRGIIKNLTKQRAVQVGIITPYTSQKSVIYRQMTQAERDVCEINTVDGFQGREKDVIVLSCVRTQQKYLGFVSDERRMNVALTRAKSVLIIVGCAQTLQRESSTWRALIEDARRRGLFQVLIKRNANKDSSQNIHGSRPASATLHQERGYKHSKDTVTRGSSQYKRARLAGHKQERENF